MEGCPLHFITPLTRIMGITSVYCTKSARITSLFGEEPPDIHLCFYINLPVATKGKGWLGRIHTEITPIWKAWAVILMVICLHAFFLLFGIDLNKSKFAATKKNATWIRAHVAAG